MSEGKKKTVSGCDVIYLHYVNEQNLGGCHQVKFLIGTQVMFLIGTQVKFLIGTQVKFLIGTQVKFLIGTRQYSAVLDTGCETSEQSKQLYNEQKSKGVENLQLSTQNVVLVGTFSRKVQRVRKQYY